MTIRSIPTTYAGINMRSKLEAAWANVFDKLGMEWCYEPEGFDFNGLWYLSDFWLPQIHTIFEVKGILGDTDVKKCEAIIPAAAARGLTYIIGYAPAGRNYQMGLPNWQQKQGAVMLTHEVSLAVCTTCDRAYFRDRNNSWRCQAGCDYHGTEDFADIADCHNVAHESLFLSDCWTPKNGDTVTEDEAWSE